MFSLPFGAELHPDRLLGTLNEQVSVKSPLLVSLDLSAVTPGDELERFSQHLLDTYCVQFSFTKHLLSTCCVQSFAEHVGQMSKWCGGGGNPEERGCSSKRIYEELKSRRQEVRGC